LGWTFLQAPSVRELELNEVRWWSKWARVSWQGEGYLLASKEFAEPFFNRAGALSCEGVGRTAAWAERRLGGQGMVSTIHVLDSCTSGRKFLLASGYRMVDEMTVFASAGPMAGNDVEVRAAMPGSGDEWARTYLRAFYGTEELADTVAPIVGRLLGTKAATLLEARVDGRTAGVLAIFRTKGVAGVYCVGTAPRYRKRGVAAGLLARAREIAEAEGRTLVLQSLASDGSGPYYSRRGFARLYSKQVMEKES
jgi:GNAT superfamily N-acetyltransferase